MEKVVPNEVIRKKVTSNIRTKNHNTKMNIHYLTPYSCENNIGKAYNDACSRIQDGNDWIVIRDGDTMFMTPNWGRHVDEVLKAKGGEYELFGAKTNRISDYHHKTPGMFDEMDLREHYKKSVELEKTEWGAVTGTTFDIAGFFMAFQKKTWERVGGFDEGTNVFDRIFTRRVRQAGGKVGLMSGLYLLHAYRLWSEEPTQSTEHLLTQDFSK